MGFYAAEAARFCRSIEDAQQMSIPWRKKVFPGGARGMAWLISPLSAKKTMKYLNLPTRIDMAARIGPD
jgi:hypothetical protein